MSYIKTVYNYLYSCIFTKGETKNNIITSRNNENNSFKYFRKPNGYKNINSSQYGK